jgi:hypothetical protein
MTLTISARSNGQIFRLESTFTPRYRYSFASTSGTEAFVEVTTRNQRRD